MNAASDTAPHQRACSDSVHRTATVSRRSLLAGVATNSLVGGSTTSSPSDPLIPLWRAWQIGKAEAEILCDRWSRQEQAIINKVNGSNLAKALENDLAETAEFLEIEKRQRTLDRQLDRLVRRIVAQSAKTPSGVTAKLSLALELADPVERTDPSWLLVEGALSDLIALDRHGRSFVPSPP